LPRLLLALCSKLATMFIDWVVFAFPFLGTFLLLAFLWSGRYPLPGYGFCPGPYGPDEAQQFTSNCSGDLSLVLACCSQSHVSLVQPVLCLPRNLFSLFRNTLLSFAQSVPDTWWTVIAPCRFDDDSSQMRVAGFGDASAPGSLAAGILAGHGAAVTHQLPSTVEAGHLAQLGRDGYSRDIRDTPAVPVDR